MYLLGVGGTTTEIRLYFWSKAFYARESKARILPLSEAVVC